MKLLIFLVIVASIAQKVGPFVTNRAFSPSLEDTFSSCSLSYPDERTEVPAKNPWSDGESVGKLWGCLYLTESEQKSFLGNYIRKTL